MYNACCFTGHRNIRPGEIKQIEERVRREVLDLIEKGVNTFYVGGAMGFDTLAAEVLLDLLSKENADIRIVSALPFPDWRDGWPDGEKQRQERIIRESDEVFYAARVHSRNAYLRRDREMVDRSGVCIAYCTRASGGTAYTVRYAMKNGLQVVNVADWDLAHLKDS